LQQKTIVNAIETYWPPHLSLLVDCVKHAYQNDSCDITKLLTPPSPLSQFVTNVVTPSPRYGVTSFMDDPFSV